MSSVFHYFALSMLLELAWDYRRGTGYYRLNDAINSLSMGILSTASKLAVYGFGAALLYWYGENFGLWRISLDSPLAWVLSFIGYDFLYYWYHRICHERQLFWASHVAHHQSEEYNLSTALRQTSMSFLYAWLFFLPCFIVGVPPEMYVTVASLNLLYQFWVHTRHLPKLGWFEWVFVTPSNHRVHHARNPRYVDRNYGGVFILWDRLFGSFQEELDEEPVEFGISKPLASWNPVRANLHIFQKMLRECLATNNLRDRFYIWIAPTAWRPADLPPEPAPDLSAKYDPACSTAAKAYALCLLLAMYLWGSYYLLAFADAPYLSRLLGFCLILAALLEAGAALENRLRGALANIRRSALVLSAAALASL
jgi:sterol desaturase/sphingolipid hydroxylase (fatty acid hydroxylase superfamily)